MKIYQIFVYNFITNEGLNYNFTILGVKDFACPFKFAFAVMEL